MADKNSYQNAYDELMKIIERLQGDEISLDNLSEEVSKATKLLTHCKEKLRKVEKEIEESLN